MVGLQETTVKVGLIVKQVSHVDDQDLKTNEDIPLVALQNQCVQLKVYALKKVLSE